MVDYTDSGGSVKNWTTTMGSETKFQICLPEDFSQEVAQKNEDEFGGWHIKEIDQGENEEAFAKLS